MAPRRTIDGNKSRRRARDELESLRETVDRLEHELARLRDTKETASGKRRAIAEAENERIKATAWRRIALQQREMRFESEVENARLREAVACQARVATELERTCRKSDMALRRDLVCGDDGETMKLKVAEGAFDIQSGVVLQMLRSSLPDLFSRAEEVFRLNKFMTNATTFRDIELRSTAECGAFVETYERELLPFDVNLTAEAVMNNFGVIDTRVLDADDEVVSNHDMTVRTPRFQGRVRSKVVVRRHVRDGTSIIAFTSISEPYRCNDFGGMYTRCFGWKRVQAISGYTDPSRPLTEVTTYFQVVPEVDTFVRDRNRKIRAFNNFLKATIGFQMDFWSDAISAGLLDRALSRHQDLEVWSADKSRRNIPT